MSITHPSFTKVIRKRDRTSECQFKNRVRMLEERHHYQHSEYYQHLKCKTLRLYLEKRKRSFGLRKFSLPEILKITQINLQLSNLRTELFGI